MSTGTIALVAVALIGVAGGLYFALRPAPVVHAAAAPPPPPQQSQGGGNDWAGMVSGIVSAAADVAVAFA